MLSTRLGRARAHAQRAYTRARALGVRIRARVMHAHVHFSGKYQGETWDHWFMPNGDVSRGLYAVCECGEERSYAVIYDAARPMEMGKYESPARRIPFPPWTPPPPEVLPWQTMR